MTNDTRQVENPIKQLGALETEARCPRTEEMDLLDTETLVHTLHRENEAVQGAVEGELHRIAAAVDMIAERMACGGRLFYIGAGTSGRLGVLDASECPPTFGVDPQLVQGIIAGGDRALRCSIEGAEDSPDAGAAEIRDRKLSKYDVVVGIAASGRTPYVIGALDAARAAGAATISIANVSGSLLAQHSDIAIEAVTGPEPLTGSTRLKAGTAQKLILNLLTTSAMIRLGKVYGNLMVDVTATNEKLRDRAVRIVAAATEVDRATAADILAAAGTEVKTAIVMLRAAVGAHEARVRLEEADGRVRQALEKNR